MALYVKLEDDMFKYHDGSREIAIPMADLKEVSMHKEKQRLGGCSTCGLVELTCVDVTDKTGKKHQIAYDDEKLARDLFRKLTGAGSEM